MNPTTLNRRAALAFALAIMLLQSGRWFLWGRWPQPLEWFIALDAYAIGALLLWGFVLAGRAPYAGRLVLAAGWGFAGGILYRSFFEHLENPARHAGHELLVLVVKGVLLAATVAGFIGAIRISSAQREAQSSS